MALRWFFYVYTLFMFSTSAIAEKAENARVPRFLSLKSNNITMRVGPGYNYPIKWEYHRTHLPLEVIAEFEDWRKIKDKSGETGWIHKSMLAKKRYVINLQDNLILHKHEEPESKPVAKLQKNVIAQIVKCNELHCLLMIKTPASTLKGWAPRQFLWGLYSHEQVIK